MCFRKQRRVVPNRGFVMLTVLHRVGAPDAEIDREFAICAG
jgi:hypothetical protein